MSETQDVPALRRLTYLTSTHAPLYRRYVDGEHVEVGEPGEYGPVDPDTGARLLALGGTDHEYSRDYTVGSSYPENGFIFGELPDGTSPDHDQLEAFLRDAGLWDEDALEPVLTPTTDADGRAVWDYGFKFTPIERAPRVERFREMLAERADDVTTVATRADGFFTVED